MEKEQNAFVQNCPPKVVFPNPKERGEAVMVQLLHAFIFKTGFPPSLHSQTAWHRSCLLGILPVAIQHIIQRACKTRESYIARLPGSSKI